MSPTRPDPLAAAPEPEDAPPDGGRGWAEALLDAEEPVLRMIGEGDPLDAVLGAICRMIEGFCPGTGCSVLLLEADGASLRWAVAPGLPPEYCRAIGPVPVGPSGGSLGAAVHGGGPVLVADIAADPRWEGFVAMTHAIGFRACWSVPILDRGGVAIGTLATFCREARLPSAWERRALTRSTHLVGTALGRRRSEESLRAGEERYRRIVETAHEGIWMIDQDQRITYVNRRMAEILGHAPAELIGRSAWDFSFPEDHPQGRERWERKRRDGERSDDEFRLRRRDGSEFWGRFATSPVVAADGRFSGALAMVTDITERRRAERALRDSEERSRQLTDTMLQIAWIGRADGSIEYFNRRWYEYTGRTPETSLTRQGWRAAAHPDDLARSGRAIRAIVTGGLFEAELRLKDREGRYRWHLCRSVPIRDDAGRVVRRFGTATDIDDRKRAETELRLGKERLELAQEIARIGTFEWEFDTGRVEWSATQEVVFGLPPGGFGGSHEEFAALVHPDDRGRIAAETRRAAEEGAEYRTEFRAVRPDGTTRWIAALGRIFAAGDGRPARMVGVNQDVTERAELEGELRRRMDDLAEADRRKDEFLATLAHELRNPLAPIRTALDLMAHPDPDGLGHEAERAMAERQAVHLARLVDDLMDVARISRGKIDLRKQAVDLATAIRNAVEAARPALLGRRQVLVLDLPEAPVRLEADPTRLEQVLDNLLTNAIKYSEPGGRITLSATVAGGEARVVVRDDGIGIEPAMLARVFEMFVQAERRPERSRGGLGIGLGLARTLVELHGGRIVARSGGPGRGSEFEVCLPLPSPAEVSPGRGPSPPAAPGGGPRRRVLVVDDNVDAAVSLARFLSRVHRQETRVAHDGPAALAEAEAFRPEIVLLDIGMPGMDGYEVARRLRAGGGFDATLLVALTGWSQDSDRARSRDAGFDRHLAKPIGPGELEAILAAVP